MFMSGTYIICLVLYALYSFISKIYKYITPQILYMHDTVQILPYDNICAVHSIHIDYNMYIENKRNNHFKPWDVFDSTASLGKDGGHFCYYLDTQVHL